MIKSGQQWMSVSRQKWWWWSLRRRPLTLERVRWSKLMELAVLNDKQPGRRPVPDGNTENSREAWTSRDLFFSYYKLSRNRYLLALVEWLQGTLVLLRFLPCHFACGVCHLVLVLSWVQAGCYRSREHSVIRQEGIEENCGSDGFFPFIRSKSFPRHIPSRLLLTSHCPRLGYSQQHPLPDLSWWLDKQGTGLSCLLPKHEPLAKGQYVALLSKMRVWQQGRREEGCGVNNEWCLPKISTGNLSFLDIVLTINVLMIPRLHFSMEVLWGLSGGTSQGKDFRQSLSRISLPFLEP